MTTSDWACWHPGRGIENNVDSNILFQIFLCLVIFFNHPASPLSQDMFMCFASVDQPDTDCCFGSSAAPLLRCWTIRMQRCVEPQAAVPILATSTLLQPTKRPHVQPQQVPNCKPYLLLFLGPLAAYRNQENMFDHSGHLDNVYGSGK